MEGKSPNRLNESDAFGALLLDIGISLMQAGANNSRIKITMADLAAVYHYEPDITIGSGSVSLILRDEDGNTLFSNIRSTSVHGINFSIISGLSRLSWSAEKNNWSQVELKKNFLECRKPAYYPRLTILFFVSLAGAAFCYTFGGGYIEMAITFIATFCGLFVKQQLTRSNFNTYFCTYAAAAVASMFVGLFEGAGILTVSPINAFSTCVLFLIPGVLLINSFIDLLDGNTISGIVKGVNALIHTLAIALGLLTTIIILNLKG
ncbi:MAG: hypothetical protein C5B52_12345 [Bacteroidetes bacterium]|nr:MAG: hypothetical protein C5B52_12345 [Bacteroidota bacterium]